MGSALKLVSGKIGIAIAESDALTRVAMIRLLSRRPGFEVVASDADIESVAATPVDIDLFLVSARPPGGGELQNSPALLRALSRGKVIMTDVTTDHRNVVDLIRLGVAGFVLRDALFAELLSTIRAVATGSHVLPPTLLSVLIRDLARESGQRATESIAAFNRMTPQQREIVMLVASGKRSGEIAAQQNISSDAAEMQIRTIMTALHPHPLHIVTPTSDEPWNRPRERRAQAAPRHRPRTLNRSIGTIGVVSGSPASF